MHKFPGPLPRSSFLPFPQNRLPFRKSVLGYRENGKGDKHMETKKESKIITLRIEKTLLEEIEKDAKADQRSRSGQIIYMLKKYYKTREDYLK